MLFHTEDAQCLLSHGVLAQPIHMSSADRHSRLLAAILDGAGLGDEDVRRNSRARAFTMGHDFKFRTEPRRTKGKHSGCVNCNCMNLPRPLPT